MYNRFLGSPRNVRVGAGLVAGMLILLMTGHQAGAGRTRPSPEIRPESAVEGRIETAFGAACETLLIREIAAARTSIHMAIYSFTRRNIAQALMDAARRGVSVEIKYDQTSADWKGMADMLHRLQKSGIPLIPVTFTRADQKMHHKFTIIDQVRVLTGSFNYTTAAVTGNDENLILIHAPEVARQFEQEYRRIGNR